MSAFEQRARCDNGSGRDYTLYCRPELGEGVNQSDWGRTSAAMRWTLLSKRFTHGDLGIGLLDRRIDSLDSAFEKWRTCFEDPLVDIVRRQ